MSLSLSIVIPAYNEANRLGKTLREIFAYLNQQEAKSEVIVVDDGSDDATVRVAEAAFQDTRGRSEASVIRVHPNHGKGHAVRTGLLAARAPIALFTDADHSTPINETEKLIAPIRDGRFDLVFGSRALDRSLIGVHQPWIREQSGRLFNLIMNRAVGLPFRDTQCGFKAFRMDVCRPIIESALIDRFGFDVELLYVARKAGLRLLEQAVHWNDVEGSKVGFGTGVQGFADLRRVKTNDRLGLYDEAACRAREQASRAPAYISEPTKIDSDYPAFKARSKAAAR
jgi:glycosyltransferase involved in cell wall biosynthesis